MSLRVTGYTPEGKRIVIDEGPAYGGSIKLGGALVVGASGPNDPARQAAYQAKHQAKREAQP